MADENSKQPQGWKEHLVLYAALAANIGIAIAKFVAAAISGSSSMLTEGFHSVIDSSNQILLLYGEGRAKKPPDKKHPFGYGRELYFWSFVVAILIFAVGAGLSVYEGYLHIVNPEELKSPVINYIVLAIAFAMEGTSWTFAMREFSEAKGDSGWWQAIRESKDPSTFVVLFEDSAACTGLIFAAIGVWASHYFKIPQIDGVASIAIGLLLGTVAILLAREAKDLLIGEGADPEVVDDIERVVTEHEAVVGVNHVRTLHTSPNGIFVAVSVDFEDDVTMGDAEDIIEEIEDRLRKAQPDLTSIYIRPEKKENAALDPAKMQKAG